jgi:uncharacterized membrane protein
VKKAPYRFFDAHQRLAMSILAAGAAFLATGRLFLATRLLVSWDTFALTAVVLAWMILCTKDPYEVRRNARLQDASMTFLFVLVVTAATVSLLAVGFVLVYAKSQSAGRVAGYVGVSVSAVIFSWVLVHTLFALRYAHLFYGNAHEKERHHALGGLLFPGRDSPDYLDFAYFSFVVGMTCQVSDVQISSRKLRRLAMVHGMISFCFNTAILAMFVNIVAGLL